MEADLWYVVVPVALALALATWLTARGQRRGRLPGRLQGRVRGQVGAESGARHQWAVATATTRDGVTAHLQVEYSWEGPQTRDPAGLDAAVADAVEDRLRRLVAARTVSALPGLGDDLGWAGEQLVPGVRVEHVSVTTSEVEVTGELRRLVQDRGTS